MLSTSITPLPGCNTGQAIVSHVVVGLRATRGDAIEFANTKHTCIALNDRLHFTYARPTFTYAIKFAES